VTQRRALRALLSTRRRVRATALAAVAALAVGGLAGLTAAPAGAAVSAPEGPAGDAFYTPPSPLPPGSPGDVIWQRTLEDVAASTTYLVLYRSTTAKGAPTAVSGTVTGPKNTRLGTAPIVGVAPPTTGLGDQCAASKESLVSSFAAPQGDMLKKGYAIATTDYEGLGTPGIHPYVVGLSEGHAVIDVVRAAQRLGLGLAATAPVGFWGYSQGGGGAAWAAELAASYGPELNVKGTVAGGIPADMIAVGKALDGSLAFGFLAAAAAGFNSAYPELNLDGYLNAKGRATFAANSEKCVVDVVGQLAFGHIADYVTSNPMDQPDWQARLRENSLGQHPPKAPIFMFHGIFDEVVPFAQDDALHKTYCRAKTNVTWSLQFGEHVTTTLSAQGDGLAFLSDRFAGKPTRGTCWLDGL
jgi:hypothetical protein